MRRRKTDVMPSLGKKRRKLYMIGQDEIDARHQREIFQVIKIMEKYPNYRYAPKMFTITAQAKAKAVVKYVDELLKVENKLVVSSRIITSSWML